MKTKNLLFSLFAVLFITAAWSCTVPVQANAASWQELEFYSNGTTKTCIKVGDYYFKQSSGKLYVSTNRSSGYVSTGISYYNVWTNGKTAYYCSYNILYKYDSSANTSTKMKDLNSIAGSSQTEENGVGVSKVYGNYIYLTRSSFDEWRFTTYKYNIKTNKVKKAKNNCDIIESSGKYCIGQNEYRTDVAPFKVTLYKISANGSLKKIKVLSKYGKNVWIINKKIYYTSYSPDCRKVAVYRCKLNGSGKKKLASLTASTKTYASNMIFISKMTSKYCVYMDYSNEQRTCYF